MKHTPDPRLRAESHCQCATCGEYFTNVRIFDSHRTDAPNGRTRCRSADELQAKGYALSPAGLWRKAPRGEPAESPAA